MPPRSVPCSSFTPASYCFDLYGANTSPAFAEVAGAIAPRVSPEVKLPYTDTLAMALTTMPTSGEVALSSHEVAPTPAGVKFLATTFCLRMPPVGRRGRTRYRCGVQHQVRGEVVFEA